MCREGRPPRVLLVEDELLIALNLQEMLGDIGVDDVACAADLETAAELIRVSPPDLAILDVNVGRTLVFPIAGELSKRGIPFAFSSAQARRDLPPEFSRRPFAPKPLEPEALNSILGLMGFGGGEVSQPHADRFGVGND